MDEKIDDPQERRLEVHLRNQILLEGLKVETADIRQRMATYELSSSELAGALRELTLELKSLAPLASTYNDVQAVFKITSWLVTNAKTIAFFIAMFYAASNSTQILKLFGIA